MKDPRQLAFETLLKLWKHQSYSNLSIAGVLGSSDLSGADKSFFTTLVYGVLERKLTLDYNLSLYLKEPLKKLNPKVYTALLLGAYQVLFLEKVPDHAAINEAVKLTRKNGVGFASGLCNAVLRKVASNGFCLPENDGSLEYYSVLYSVPVPLIRLWVDAYGLEKTEGILQDALGPRPLT
ncbi:MAG: transcription antitermination factor NusB, partial [Eubacteriales bacterium]|nr:transcription antitermination factor NusB [Eubacteriales bacterium]